MPTLFSKYLTRQYTYVASTLQHSRLIIAKYIIKQSPLRQLMAVFWILQANFYKIHNDLVGMK